MANSDKDSSKKLIFLKNIDTTHASRTDIKPMLQMTTPQTSTLQTSLTDDYVQTVPLGAFFGKSNF